jgi:uncharacterized protein YdaU (DUF1376 family)
MSDDTAMLPDPPVPADCDLRAFTFMQLDVQRLRDSDLALESTGDEFKAALLLWCASWHQVPAASLPNSDRALAKLAGCTPAEWTAVRSVALAGFFLCADGRLYHSIVAEKAREAYDKSTKLAEASRKGNAARWGSRPPDPPPSPAADAPRPPSPTLSDPGATPSAIRPDIRAESPPDPLAIRAGVPTRSGGDPKEKEKEKEKDFNTLPPPIGVGVASGPPDAPPALPGFEPLPGRPSPDPVYAVPPCPADRLFDLYAQRLPSLPQVAVRSDARRRSIAARWREVCGKERWTAEEGLDWFGWFFGRVAESAFLLGNRGRPGERAFRADFDWLTAPTNFARVIEGRYHDEGIAA